LFADLTQPCVFDVSSCTSADITAFFKGMQVVADGIFLCSHADGRPTGEAFVEFTNEETAARAMQLHREPMGSVCCFAQKQLHRC
jgi:RNA recognition motif-containing protein